MDLNAALQTEARQVLSSESTSRSEWFLGGEAGLGSFEEGSLSAMAEWADSVPRYPVPIKYRLTELSALLNSNLFDDDLDIITKRDALIAYLEEELSIDVHCPWDGSNSSSLRYGDFVILAADRYSSGTQQAALRLTSSNFAAHTINYDGIVMAKFGRPSCYDQVIQAAQEFNTTYYFRDIISQSKQSLGDMVFPAYLYVIYGRADGDREGTVDDDLVCMMTSGLFMEKESNRFSAAHWSMPLPLSSVFIGMPSMTSSPETIFAFNLEENMRPEFYIHGGSEDVSLDCSNGFSTPEWDQRKDGAFSQYFGTLVEGFDIAVCTVDTGDKLADKYPRMFAADNYPAFRGYEAFDTTYYLNPSDTTGIERLHYSFVVTSLETDTEVVNLGYFWETMLKEWALSDGVKYDNVGGRFAFCNKIVLNGVTISPLFHGLKEMARGIRPPGYFCSGIRGTIIIGNDTYLFYDHGYTSAGEVDGEVYVVRRHNFLSYMASSIFFAPTGTMNPVWVESDSVEHYSILTLDEFFATPEYQIDMARWLANSSQPQPLLATPEARNYVWRLMSWDHLRNVNKEPIMFRDRVHLISAEGPVARDGSVYVRGGHYVKPSDAPPNATPSSFIIQPSRTEDQGTCIPLVDRNSFYLEVASTGDILERPSNYGVAARLSLRAYGTSAFIPMQTYSYAHFGEAAIDNEVTQGVLQAVRLDPGNVLLTSSPSTTSSVVQQSKWWAPPSNDSLSVTFTLSFPSVVVPVDACLFDSTSEDSGCVHLPSLTSDGDVVSSQFVRYDSCNVDKIDVPANVTVSLFAIQDPALKQPAPFGSNRQVCASESPVTYLRSIVGPATYRLKANLRTSMCVVRFIVDENICMGSL